MPHYRYLLPLALGLLLPAHLSQLPTTVSIVALSLLALATVNLSWGRICCCFLLGFLLSCARLEQRVAAQLPLPLEGRDLTLEIGVVELPHRAEDRVRFHAIVDGVEVDDPALRRAAAGLEGRRLRLSWRAAPQLRPGQRWRLTARLRRPRGLANPGGFDYQAWLLARGIAASGYVRAERANTLLEEAPPDLIDRARLLLDTKLFAGRDAELTGILRALLIGDKSAVSQTQWDTLHRTGTTHLMAISGLHIGLVAVLAFLCARRCLALTPLHSRLRAVRAIPGLCSLVCAATYAAISGFSIPTQRAFTLVLIVNLAYLLGRRCSPFYLLSCAAVLVLAGNPLASTQHGFWLSFGAVFFLLFCFAFTRSDRGKLSALARSQAAVFCGMAIILPALGVAVSLSSPLANIIAVPVMSLIVIPLLFLSAVLVWVNAYLSALAFDLAYFCLSKLWGLLAWLSEFDSLYTRALPPLWLTVVALLGVMLLLARAPLRLRWVGLSLMLIFLGPQPVRPEQVKIVVLDVGQGLAVVIRTRNHSLVYDVGARFGDNFDIGSRVLAPYLLRQGVDRLSLLAISHADNDHAGGLAGLAKSIAFEVLAYNDVEASPAKRTSCVAGRRWRFDDVRLRVLWPQAEKVVGVRNNASCVIVLEVGEFQMLLAGDIERSVEHILLAEGRLPRDIEVLVAPHHGSRTSSSRRFVRHLAPQHVVFSAGYKNPYRHPADEVLGRYLDVGSRAWNTAADGAITIEVSADGGVAVSAERRQNPKPWYSRRD